MLSVMINFRLVILSSAGSDFKLLSFCLPFFFSFFILFYFYQDYDAMVKLVETLEMLPTCDLADQHNIKFHYAFALNR